VSNPVCPAYFFTVSLLSTFLFCMQAYVTNPVWVIAAPVMADGKHLAAIIWLSSSRYVRDVTLWHLAKRVTSHWVPYGKSDVTPGHTLLKRLSW
jgi:hypothetical protein